MRTGSTARGIAATGAALLALTACGGGGDDGGGNALATAASGEKQINIYGTDGNMGNALGEHFDEKGALAGMKGTTPLTDLGQDFKDRLLEVDPELQDYNYSAETYDAVVLSGAGRRRWPAPTTPTSSRPTSTASRSVATSARDFASPASRSSTPAATPTTTASPARWRSPTPVSPPRRASRCCSSATTTRSTPHATEFVLAGDEENAATDEGPAAGTRRRDRRPADASATCCR